MAKIQKSFREPSLPLSVGLLGMAFIAYGVAVGLFDHERFLAVFNESSPDSSPVGIAMALFPMVLAVLGAGLLFKSNVARDLIVGISYAEVVGCGVLVMVAMFAPESLRVLFPSSHVVDGKLYLFSQSTWTALASIGLYFVAGMVQLSVLKAKPTRRAFGLAY